MQFSTSEVISRFRSVFEEACRLGIEDPNAMVLGTVSPAGQPSARVVLLKGFDEQGFVFFTNLGSRKAQEIAGNPQVSLSFFWRELSRQLTVLGRAQAVSSEEADEYFASRPRQSQIGAWASRQSQTLASHEQLLAEVAHLEQLYAQQPVPRPPHWSGFRVVPSSIEIWAAGEFRLHQRERFERQGEAWQWRLLYP